MKIQVENQSTVVGPEDFDTVVAACAAQLREEFSVAWELVPCEVICGGPTDPDAFQMTVFDNSTDPGALGYHDVDDKGRPRGFVFAKETMNDGGKWSVTLSHELLEMRGDEYISTWVQAGDGKMRAFEMCDAVENDEYEKQVGDTKVSVSNFLLPAYFSETPVVGERTDYLDRLAGKPAPARTPGGYDIVIDTSGQPSQEFSQHMASLPPGKQASKASPFSRTSRRLAARI
jgi:hypothetical protein